MNCGSNLYQGSLQETMDAMNAVAAYDLAVEFAEKKIRNLVGRFAAGLQCPGGCKSLAYNSASLTFTPRRVWGGPSPKLANHYRIVVEVSYRFEVTCSEVPAPQPVLEEVPPTPAAPGSSGGSSSSTAPGGGGGGGVVPAGPCTVSTTLSDNSTRDGIGIATWNFDITITATASNPAHTWGPMSCLITGVNYSSTGAPLSWAAANYIGLTTSLVTGVGLTITPGAGVATITGSLVPGTKGIAGMPGSLVQILGVATDSAGDTHPFEYIVQQP